VADPIARSPIHPAEPVIVAGWEVSGRRSTAGLTLADLTPLAKAAVRAPAGGAMARALGVRSGRAARDSTGALVIRSAPGEWLVLAPAGECGALTRRLSALAGQAAGGELVTVLDATHGHALMRLTGTAAAATLAKVCGLDLAEDAAPQGAAFRTSVAEAVAGLVRDDVDGPSGPARSYLLHCERSYGQYLFGALLDAGGEFGIEADGFREAAPSAAARGSGPR
jgi:heterotetrameric sarcosine oxidase gamma subunit